MSERLKSYCRKKENKLNADHVWLLKNVDVFITFYPRDQLEVLLSVDIWDISYESELSILQHLRRCRLYHLQDIDQCIRTDSPKKET